MKSDIRTASPRNLQLDFFRGLALMIIFINHMPSNPWFHYTPSRLGPSDAAETFVFLSGFAAAIAFGRSFQQAGTGLGSIRVLYRCCQIYLAQITLFLSIAAILSFGNHINPNIDYIQRFGLDYFFNHTQNAILELLTLQYIPNHIDILPMYLVILLWLPMVWALSRIHTGLALAFPVLMYIFAFTYDWELPADPASDRSWYFNPFYWQLIFFTGFAISRGWLPIPRYRPALAGLCVLLAIFCYPLENAFGYQNLPFFATLRDNLAPVLDKSHLGLLRWLHFLAMAYLLRHLFRNKQHWLQQGIQHWVVTMGQQSLPIFMFGACLSFMGGILLETMSMNLFNSALINIGGLGLMLLMARLLSWLDQKPWKIVSVNTNDGHTENRSKHAILAFSLLFLTITPLLFINKQAAEISLSETSTDEQSPPQFNDTPPITTERVTFQTQENNLELPDTL